MVKNYPGDGGNFQLKVQLQHIAETNKLVEANGEILTESEMLLVKNLWRKAKRFKIELEDLLQEARLAKCMGIDVKEHLERYIETWRRDVCSTAGPLPLE
ncbi:MAG: hypothetical protein ABFD97_20230 [Syntrophobacter sp.]